METSDLLRLANPILTGVITLFLSATLLAGERFVLAGQQVERSILVDNSEPATVAIAARMLQEDLYRLTGVEVPVVNSAARAGPVVLVIGTVDGELVRSLSRRGLVDPDAVRGQWETYGRTVVDRPFPGVRKALVIYGSDKRGAAYGVVDLSRELGISPWYWWADVTIRKVASASVEAADHVSTPPSVKYRGVFLNDEDWALQPWAAKTFEPETGDIGPRTYAKIFELLLRLKANSIWPAMHESTRAFYHYPENPRVAGDYGIVIGTSHAEPMLRNNVDEWDPGRRGEFNYLTNRENVVAYWEERAEQASGDETIYTLGMRGIHDSPMVGTTSLPDRVEAMERIIADQREILGRNVGAVESVPQALTPYKEVLEIYDAGLRVPEDVSLVWPDDNHGYIRRLSNAEERQRSGGAGVYYHLSYWGSPHDYLWLSSTHPSLIRAEMTKAYANGARRIWIGNVGDIKPIEYNMQLFLDIAFDAEAFAEPGSEKAHLKQWLGDIFGKRRRDVLTRILWEYHGLARERRPEFMAWNRVEPRTVPARSGFNHFYYNDEAERRLLRYERLVDLSTAVRSQIADDRADAFYQLVHYPVIASAAMNRKFLHLEKAYLYAAQNRASANDHAGLANEAYETIGRETRYYNDALSGGKWRYMMDMAPRDLSVFDRPPIPRWPVSGGGGWGLVVEGRPEVVHFHDDDLSYRRPALPKFAPETRRSYFFDVFMSGADPVPWRAEPLQPWVSVSPSEGTLRNSRGNKEARVWVSIDWARLPIDAAHDSGVVVELPGRELRVDVEVEAARSAKPGSYIPDNGIVSIHAENFLRSPGEPANAGWQIVPGLGYTGTAIRSARFNREAGPQNGERPAFGGYVEYPLHFNGAVDANVVVHALPTHPVTDSDGLRLGIALGDGPVTVLDYASQPNSGIWARQVLANSAARTWKTRIPAAGDHRLRVYALDPDVILDRIEIETAPAAPRYSALPETGGH